MEKCQIYFGRKFYLRKKSGYWATSQPPYIRAHAWVWTNHFGSPPIGTHLHHKDGNKSNNAIENLELLTATEHTRLHLHEPERKELSRKACDKIRHLTKDWHKTDAGLEWHRLNGLKSWKGRQPKVSFCKRCNQKILSLAPRGKEFCTRSCKTRYNYKKNKEIGLLP